MICPPERPYLDESTMKCVSKVECGCFDEGERYEEGQEMPTNEICQTWYGTFCIMFEKTDVMTKNHSRIKKLKRYNF